MNEKNKLFIIFLLIILTFVTIITIIKKPKQNKLTKISDEEAKKIISETFGDESLSRVNGQALSLANTRNYMTLVVKDQYLLIDFSQNPPKIHQFESQKPKISVTVLKIEDGRFLVHHDDHEHWVEGKPDDNVKVGDVILIKDPHTYLQDDQ